MALPAPCVTAPSDIAVEARGVSKSFYQKQAGKGVKGFLHPEKRAITALKNVDLVIRRGEFVAYAGPNGAGKSTTFKLLCGLLAPDAGDVRVLGYHPMKERIPLMMRTGVLFGNRTELWWDHPVRASLEWKKTVWEIPEDVYRERLSMLTALLGMDEFLNTFARELSLGQRMRADLAMALVSRPELVLLDEPTLGLDVLAKRMMIDFLKYINREEGVTILVTSHDMDDLTEMSKRLILINKGEIAFDGTAEKLKPLTGDQRQITLEYDGKTMEIAGLTRLSEEGARHTYTFDASVVSMRELLSRIAAIEGVRDIETGREPIETVIAKLYLNWRQETRPRP